MVLSLLILILLLYIHPIYTHESELTINYTNAGVFENKDRICIRSIEAIDIYTNRGLKK